MNGTELCSSEAFRRLRANVVAAASRAQARSILVTSVDSGDGSRSAVGNLAAALALAGKRVVVVLAWRDMALEDRLGISGGPGFLDALVGAVAVEDTLHATRFEHLMFCGRGREAAHAAGSLPVAEDGTTRAVPTSSDLLGSDRPKHVLGVLAAGFDYVLVDAPPVQEDADAYLLAGACDATLAVATLARATQDDLEQASGQLGQAGATVLGSVIIDPKSGETIDDLWTAESRSHPAAGHNSEIAAGTAGMRASSNGALAQVGRA